MLFAWLMGVVQCATPDECSHDSLLSYITHSNMNALKMCTERKEIRSSGVLGQNSNELLFKALNYNDRESGELLLAGGVNPNGPAAPNCLSPSGDLLPLQRAVLKRDALIEVLLENGADPNLIGAQGESALHWATEYRSVDVVKQLVDHGGDLWVADKRGRNAFDHARVREELQPGLDEYLKEQEEKGRPKPPGHQGIPG
jgi:hypothetical protein